MAGKATIFQPNRAGQATPQILDNVHHVSDRTAEHAHSVEAGKARSFSGGIDPRVGGRPKRSVVQVHGAMTRQQSDAAGVGGMGHATAVVDGGVKLATSAPAAPLAHAYGGKPNLKVGKAAAPVVGHRSRNAPHDPALGKAILQEAFDNSAPDDRLAHGRD